ncbi:MAG: hypothetical protein WDN46_03580 [Methylocella sp.]
MAPLTALEDVFAVEVRADIFTAGARTLDFDFALLGSALFDALEAVAALTVFDVFARGELTLLALLAPVRFRAESAMVFFDLALTLSLDGFALRTRVSARSTGCRAAFVFDDFTVFLTDLISAPFCSALETEQIINGGL